MKNTLVNWKNPAATSPISQQDAIRIANIERFREIFTPDYYQVLKRISDVPRGLRYGSPPGIVG